MVQKIIIRKGINGFNYAACDEKGQWFGNLEKLSDASHRWAKDIKYGHVLLIRELDKYPEAKVTGERK